MDPYLALFLVIFIALLAFGIRATRTAQAKGILGDLPPKPPEPKQAEAKREKPFVFVQRPPGEGFWASIVNVDRRKPELYGKIERLPTEYDYWTKARIEANRAADSRSRQDKTRYHGFVVDKHGTRLDDSPDHPTKAASS
jgi:hypothetical protein